MPSGLTLLITPDNDPSFDSLSKGEFHGPAYSPKKKIPQAWGRSYIDTPKTLLIKLGIGDIVTCDNFYIVRFECQSGVRLVDG